MNRLAILAAACAPTLAMGATIVNDTSFTDGQYLYATDAPSPSLTTGSTLIFDTGVAGTSGASTSVIRPFANQQLNVGDTLTLKADVTIGAAYDAFKREFVLGFYALNGAPGLGGNLSDNDWGASNQPISSVFAAVDTRTDPADGSQSVLYAGRRSGGTNLPVSPVNPVGASATPSNQVTSDGIGGRTYTLTFTVTRQADAQLNGSGGLEQNVLVDLEIFGDFNGDNNPFTLQHDAATIFFPNTDAGPLDDFDGIVFGSTTSFGGSTAEVDFTLDNVLVEYSPIPEPASLGLSLLGLAGLGLRRRR